MFLNNLLENKTPSAVLGHVQFKKKSAHSSTCWIWPAWGLLSGVGGPRSKKNRKKKRYIGCTMPVISAGSEGDESAVKRQVEE